MGQILSVSAVTKEERKKAGKFDLWESRAQDELLWCGGAPSPEPNPPSEMARTYTETLTVI